MLKHTLLMSSFAVALMAMPVEAQSRRVVCAWNDAECLRREQDRARSEARADERRVCAWNDADCLRREQERARNEARASERREVGYDYERRRDRGAYERGRGERRDEIYRRRGNVRHGRLPHMSSALAIRNGKGMPKDARAWLGRGPFRVELVNRDRDRLPERATIRSTRSREVQVWVDRNNDGWADHILFYRNGRLVREVR